MDLAIAPAGISIPVDALLLDANIFDIIATITLPSVVGSVTITDIALSGVTIEDTDNG